ncbi:Smr/MutS family protein [bacterium]|nr:Smr/MutS family protein [bacterium]
MKIDLHGYTIHVAWKEFTSHVTNCYHQRIKTTMVITGQGDIAKELPSWASNNPYVRSCDLSQRNPGIYTIKISKAPAKQQTYNQTTKVDLSPLLAKFNKV